MRRGKQSATNPLLPAKLQGSFLWTPVPRTAHSHQLPQGVLTCESFTVQHTWGEGRPSVSGNWLSQRKSRWITYFQLMPWKEDQSWWNQKRNTKKKKKQKKQLNCSYLCTGEKTVFRFLYITVYMFKFLWFKGRSQTTDPNSSWSEVKARSAKRNQQLI